MMRPQRVRCVRMYVSAGAGGSGVACGGGVGEALKRLDGGGGVVVVV